VQNAEPIRCVLYAICSSTGNSHVNQVVVLPIENSRSCVGKRPYNNWFWLCSWEFSALKRISVLRGGFLLALHQPLAIIGCNCRRGAEFMSGMHLARV
jgi:hypothetical protein